VERPPGVPPKGPGDEPESDEAASLEERQRTAGRLPGDRYVRIVRPAEFRRGHGGIYVATASATEPETRLGRLYDRFRRSLFGRPLATESETDERVSSLTGLGVLAPSNVSSSAYATEEAMRVLALGGIAVLSLAMPVAFVVILLLGVIVLSESRIIRAYPQGGGAYVVVRDDLGVIPGLVAAAALLLDYILTVAVSIAAGLTAVSSFLPAIHEERVLWGAGLIGLLAIGHLRGIRAAGVIFAAPTYAYIAVMLTLVAVGIYRVATGDVPDPVLPEQPFIAGGVQAFGILLLVRAFAAGSVAMTGTEAVAPVVPNFRDPPARNAIRTLLLMAGTLSVLFLGLTFLATRIGILPDMAEIESVNSMLARSVFGTGSIPWYAVQIATAVFLLVAANTGFSGFPRFASVVANDRFMPRQFAMRGERLAFSFGIVALAVLAIAVLAAFGGSLTALVPLYLTAVFLAFTLSQAALVRRWWRDRGALWLPGLALNLFGVAAIGGILTVVAVTRFVDGAWLVVVGVALLVAALYGIHHHYRSVADALTLDEPHRPLPKPRPPVVVVPVARLDRAAVQALAFASSISNNVRAVHIATSQASAREFRRRWDAWGGKHLWDGGEIGLDVIDSPYRSLLQPLLRYIDRMDERDPRPITVVLAEFVPHHWWEFLLHSQTAFRIKAALLFRPNTIVIDVPYHFEEAGSHDH
jgi:amino acid transporter